MRSRCVGAACAVVLAFASMAHSADVRDRKTEGKEATGLKVPQFSGVSKAAVSPPELFFTSKARHCSSFDLKGGTLNYVGDTFAQVYPLVYQGKVGNVYIYWEASPYDWVWYFEDKGGNSGSVYYQPSRTSPIFEFDVNAARLTREP